MEPVGQLHQDDPDVLAHGEDELAEVFGLGLLLGTELELSNLRHTVDQLGDFVVESVDQLGACREAVLHGVVQEACRDGVHVHSHVGEDAGHRQWVGQVVLAAAPHLPIVSVCCKEVRLHDEADLCVGRVGLYALDDVLDVHGPIRG